MPPTDLPPPRYASPKGGLPPQRALMSQRAVFTESYMVIPHGCFSDIWSSLLPAWEKTKTWIIARPMSGFVETFSHYILEVAPEGGSDAPEPDADAEGWLFVTDGQGQLSFAGRDHALRAGSFAYLPPQTPWRLRAHGTAALRFHWLRKRYAAVAGLAAPPPLVTNERDITPEALPDTQGVWATTRFVAPDDLRHDAHVSIVTFQPGGTLPFEETHVMEHGLYVLEGKGVYKLNRDWVEVEAGDYIAMRAFCPQACYAGGPEPFRYLLYKDVNRHAALRPRRALGA